MNILDFKKNEYLFWMNILDIQKNEYLLWMNILEFSKMNNFLNKYFDFSLPASKMVVAKCLKLIWNHSGIISGTYFSPFQGFYYLYRGLRRALRPYFGLILEFWIFFSQFEWLVGPISFQGFYYLYRGLRRAPKPYFGLILEFWIIFLIFLEWIILLNIMNSIE